METIFLSHSTYVKESLVVPFAQDLAYIHVPFWFDRKDILCGTGIYENIMTGITQSDYCVAFIDETFLKKDWPMKEANLFHEKEVKNGSKIIFPVFCGISKDKVYENIPWLKGRAFETVSSASLYATGEREKLLCRIMEKYLCDHGTLTDISDIERIAKVNSSNAFFELLKTIYKCGYFSSEKVQISCMELCNIANLLYAISRNAGNNATDLFELCMSITDYVKKLLSQNPECITYDHVLAVKRSVSIMIQELSIFFNIR